VEGALWYEDERDAVYVVEQLAGTLCESCSRSLRCGNNVASCLRMVRLGDADARHAGYPFAGRPLRLSLWRPAPPAAAQPPPPPPLFAAPGPPARGRHKLRMCVRLASPRCAASRSRGARAAVWT
jgi:hypothetical protein